LASLSEGWLPCVAVVRQGDAIRAVLYGKERSIGPFRSGIVYVDGRLGHFAAANAAPADAAMTAALEAMLAAPGILGVRLAIPAGGVADRAVAGARTSTRVDAGYARISPFELHAVLSLPASYPEFLAGVGDSTRRNLKRYPRRFEADGHLYVDRLTPQELEQAAAHLRTKCRAASSEREIARALNTVAASDRPWAIGLKHRDGEWMGAAAGWHSGDRA